MGLLKLKEVMGKEIMENYSTRKQDWSDEAPELEEVREESPEGFMVIDTSKISRNLSIPVPPIKGGRRTKKDRREDLDEIDNRIEDLRVGECFLYDLSGFDEKAQKRIRGALGNGVSNIVKARSGKRKFAIRYLRDGLEGNGKPVVGVWRVL